MGVRIISHRRFGSSNAVEDLLENINNTANVLLRSFHFLMIIIADNVKVDIPESTLFSNRTRRARIVAPWDLECPRCNIDLELKTNERKQMIRGEGNYCRAHRWLHKIGHEQRTRDSSLRQPSKDKGSIDFPPKQREVLSVARIDGNSIGWILNPVRFEGSEANFSDGIRRRSMRFNAMVEILSYARTGERRGAR